MPRSIARPVKKPTKDNHMNISNYLKFPRVIGENPSFVQFQTDVTKKIQEFALPIIAASASIGMTVVYGLATSSPLSVMVPQMALFGVTAFVGSYAIKTLLDRSSSTVEESAQVVQVAVKPTRPEETAVVLTETIEQTGFERIADTFKTARETAIPIIKESAMKSLFAVLALGKTVEEFGESIPYDLILLKLKNTASYARHKIQEGAEFITPIAQRKFEEISTYLKNTAGKVEETVTTEKEADSVRETPSEPSKSDNQETGSN